MRIVRSRLRGDQQRWAEPATDRTTAFPVMTTVLWWLLLPLVALLGVVLWATESRSTRINRLRSSGHTWATIATRYGVSASTARRWAAG